MMRFMPFQEKNTSTYKVFLPVFYLSPSSFSPLPLPQSPSPLCAYPLSLCPVKRQQEDSLLPTRKKALTRIQPCWHSDLDFQLRELGEYKFLWFKPPIIWYFVIAAQPNRCSFLLKNTIIVLPVLYSFKSISKSLVCSSSPSYMGRLQRISALPN